MNLESEELNMEKIPEWIYAPTNFSPELEEKYYSEAETGKQEKNTIPEFTPEYGKRIWL